MEFAVFFQMTFFILVTQVKNLSSQGNLLTKVPNKNAQIYLLNRNNQVLQDKLRDLSSKLAKCNNDVALKEQIASQFARHTKGQQSQLEECLKNLQKEQNYTQKCEDEKREMDTTISELKTQLTAKEREYEECENEIKSLEESIKKYDASTVEKDIELKKCRKDLQEKPNKTKQCEDEKRQLDPTLNELRANLTDKERVYEVCERKRAPLRTRNQQILNELNEEREKRMIYEKTIVIIEEEIERLKKGPKVIIKVDQVETKQECPIMPNIIDILNAAQTVKKGFSDWLRSIINKFKMNEK